jgi:hypothetical protein
MSSIAPLLKVSGSELGALIQAKNGGVMPALSLPTNAKPSTVTVGEVADALSQFLRDADEKGWLNEHKTIDQLNGAIPFDDGQHVEFYVMDPGKVFSTKPRNRSQTLVEWGGKHTVWKDGGNVTKNQIADDATVYFLLKMIPLDRDYKRKLKLAGVAYAGAIVGAGMLLGPIGAAFAIVPGIVVGGATYLAGIGSIRQST